MMHSQQRDYSGPCKLCAFKSGEATFSARMLYCAYRFVLSEAIFHFFARGLEVGRSGGCCSSKAMQIIETLKK